VPTTAKPRKRSSRSTAKNGGAPSTPKKASTSRATTNRRTEPESNGLTDKVEALTDKARDSAGTVARGAAAATIGTAIAAIAGRKLIASRRSKHVLGIPMPRKRTSMKSVAKQFASIAGDVERKSTDLSKVSAKAKQAAKSFS
jgi:hypothetical protein